MMRFNCEAFWIWMEEYDKHLKKNKLLHSVGCKKKISETWITVFRNVWSEALSFRAVGINKIP